VLGPNAPWRAAVVGYGRGGDAAAKATHDTPKRKRRKGKGNGKEKEDGNAAAIPIDGGSTRARGVTRNRTRAWSRRSSRTWACPPSRCRAPKPGTRRGRRASTKAPRRRGARRARPTCLPQRRFGAAASASAARHAPPRPARARRRGGWSNGTSGQESSGAIGGVLRPSFAPRRHAPSAPRASVPSLLRKQESMQ